MILHFRDHIFIKNRKPILVLPLKDVPTEFNRFFCTDEQIVMYLKIERIPYYEKPKQSEKRRKNEQLFDIRKAFQFFKNRTPRKAITRLATIYPTNAPIQPITLI